MEKKVQKTEFCQPHRWNFCFPARKGAQSANHIPNTSVRDLRPVSPQIFSYRKYAQKSLYQLAGQQSVQISLDTERGNQPEDKEQAESKAYYAEEEGGGSFP